MKKYFVIFVLIFAFGCSEDSTGPEENSIVGKWQKLIYDTGGEEEVLLIIEFTDDNKYYVETSLDPDSGPFLEGTYTFVGSILLMVDDKCEEIEGKYKIEFENNGFTVELIEDECNRSESMPGTFIKYTTH